MNTICNLATVANKNNVHKNNTHTPHSTAQQFPKTQHYVLFCFIYCFVNVLQHFFNCVQIKKTNEIRFKFVSFASP